MLIVSNSNSNWAHLKMYQTKEWQQYRGIIGVGGGEVMDQTKAAADILKREFRLVPRLLSTDAMFTSSFAARIPEGVK